MSTLSPILKKARKFKVSQICEKSTLSRRTIYALLSGECQNPRLETMKALEKAVTKLEAAAARDAAKMKSRQNTAKKQTPLRDKRRAAVASTKSS